MERKHLDRQEPIEAEKGYLHSYDAALLIIFARFQSSF